MYILNELLKKQKELQERLIRERKLPKLTDTNYWLKQNVLAIFSETNELLDEINWKHWKAEKELNIENIKYETIDLLHFLLTIFVVLDMDEVDIRNYYLNKNKENHARQDGVVEGREDYKA